MLRWPEQVQPMPVDAAQVTPIEGDAVAIEKIQNLDCDLAPVLDAIAKLGCGKAAVFRAPGDIGDDPYHLMGGRTQEKMIVRDFVRPSQPSGQLEKPPDISFGIRGCGCDVADTGRTETRFAAK